MTTSPELPADFHQRFATWLRLEPRCRSNDPSLGLQARTADPLWMLTRQWQTGEFIGEDAGSPLQVDLTYSTQSLDSVKLGQDGDIVPLPDMPLEAVVEAEDTEMRWRGRVQAGQQFERFLHASVTAVAAGLDPDTVVQTYRDTFVLQRPDQEIWQDLDDSTQRFVGFMAGRVTDGDAVLTLANENDIPLLAGLTQITIDEVADSLRQWASELNYRPAAADSRAWRNQQLDYTFELNADTGAAPAPPAVSSAEIGRRFQEIVREVLQRRRGVNISSAIRAYRREYNMLRSRTDKSILDWLYYLIATLFGRPVVDGNRILQEIENKVLRLLGGISRSMLEEIVKRLMDWLDEQQPRPADTAKTHLVGPDYRNGELDWYTLNTNSTARGLWQQQTLERKLPTLVTVGGTSPRWWAFEDSATDFGKIDASKPDLAKLLLMEFVLIYADDWFSIPIPVRFSNLVRIDSLQVLNVFGDHPNVDPVRKNVIDNILEQGGDAEDPLLRWEAFSLARSDSLQQDYDDLAASLTAGSLGATQRAQNEARLDEIRSAADMLLITPAAGFREESKPSEEVRFIRDEGANMIWGVETRVQNGIAHSVDGFHAQLARTDRYREREIDDLQIQLVAKLAEVDQAAADLFTARADNTTPEEQIVAFEQALALLQAEAAELRARLRTLRDGRQYASQGAPRYRLATTVPENWIPFIPTSAQPYFNTGYSSMRLRRAQMLRNEDDLEPTPITAMTRLLEMRNDPLLWLEESAVPRSGVRVQLTSQRVRWTDGKTYVWSGRKVTAGRGEGSSGLMYDISED